MKNVFNISITYDFYAYLAEKYSLLYKDNPLNLADITFLMPSKRAVASLRAAFLQVFDLKPMILPQIKDICEFDEDELLLKVDNFSNIKQAISKDERIFFFIKLIMAKNNMSLNQAFQLALELSALLDEAENLEVDLNKLQQIIPTDFSLHVQETFEFLKIITQNWPLILKEQNKLDVAQRQKELLYMAAQNLVQSNTKVVIAGVSAPFVGIKNLMKSLLNSNNVEIYFYGVDNCLSDEEWQTLPDIHPCFEAKKMLDYLELNRNDLTNICGDEIKEEFVSELMRPATSSENWQNINPNLKSFFDNVNIIEADNLSQEALVISLLIRKQLEEDKEVALVCPDRNLSRQVCSELKRFDIEVDDSAGRPLSSCPLGAYMRLLLDCVGNDNVVSFLSLVKHPYFNKKDFVKEYEKIVLRQKKENEELIVCANVIKSQLVLPERCSLKDMLQEHINLGHKFCDKLFVKEEGRLASQLFTKVLENCDLIDDISLSDYKDYFDTLLSGVSVRQNYNTYPKVKILGSIEARFNKFDTIIIGACNEGMWPLSNNANPWLSESMKKDLGLSSYSYKAGINAFDFACGVASDNVYITRSIKSGGTPQVKSRFLLKLEALAKLLNVEMNKKEEFVYKKLSGLIDEPLEFVAIEPPAPCPPVEARPKHISASQIETWIKDPYSIYAKYVLSLYPLDDLKQELDAKDYGTIIHNILEIFYKKHSAVFPLNAGEEIMQIGEDVFANSGLTPERIIFWKARLNKIVEHIVKVENEYSIGVKSRECEVSSELNLGGFVLKAKADRIDTLTDGSLNIIDYKTGGLKSQKEIYSGYGPQLPAEGLIFSESLKVDVANLIYWQLGKKEAVFNKNLDELFLKSKEQLLTMIAEYNKETTPYYSCPDATQLPKYSDYEHLARIAEWRVKGDFDD